MKAQSVVTIFMRRRQTYEQDYVSIEHSIDGTGNDKNVIARDTVRRNGFVPESMYWLAAFGY